MDEKRPIEIELPVGKKIYFASDLHLGVPNKQKSKLREKFFIQWLIAIEKDVHTLFILGDLFDFWFEYKEVVPKGFVRVLAKLADLVEKGITIHFFTGNHDIWMRDYLEVEIGMKIHRERKDFLINNQLFLIGHGDGLGPDDKGFKLMKKLFTNSLAILLFRQIHPDLGVWLGRKLSLNNKMISGKEAPIYKGDESEWLVQYARKKIESKPYKYFIFGHRHLPIVVPISKEATYVNLGDWINQMTYSEFDGKNLSLLKYQTK